MDYRSVLMFLCVLIAQTASGPVRNGTTTGVMQLMREEIQTALDHLAAPGLLPNISCLSLNIVGLLGPEQQPLTTQHLSSIRCYMLKLSKLTPELSHELETISQYTQDVELLKNGTTTNGDCSLPSFQQDMDSYVYARCLLQLLDQRLSKAEF